MIKLKFKRAMGVKRQVYDFKNRNFDDLRESLSRVPFEIVASADINEFWDNSKALFLSAVKDHIPIKTVRNINSPPWIDSEVHHWIRKKYTALKKFRLNKTPERKRKLRILSQTVKVLVRTKHQRYLTKIEASFKDNPKNFWSYQKAFLGGRSSANLTISYNHEVAETLVGKAELFNKYFCSVFLPTTYGLNNSEYITSSSITDMEISQIEVTVDEVMERLSELDTTKACGPDKLSPAEGVQRANSTHSLSIGQIPREWKSADVTPIHKKDSKEDAKKYRAISLLPIVSKVLECWVAIDFTII